MVCVCVCLAVRESWVRDGKGYGERGGPKSCSLTKSEGVRLEGPHVAGVRLRLNHHHLGGCVVIPLAESKEVAVAAEAQEALIVGTLGHLGGVQGLNELLIFLRLVVNGPSDGTAGGHDNVAVRRSGPLGTVGFLGLCGGVGSGGGGQGGVTGLLLLQLTVNRAAKADEVAVRVTSEPEERMRE